MFHHMTSDAFETREIEVELVLPNWDGEFPADCPRLSANYFREDRRETGMGLVISEDMPTSGDLDRVISEFLTPILNDANILKAYSPILRIAIYNRAFTCSMNIKCLPLLVMFGAELDIVVYPTSEDE
jgi:hypothetical protein